MISKKQLVELAKKTDLNLYQQEKDYLLKLFLYHYYKKNSQAVFKGGTCIRYLYGLNRFSEDLDFILRNQIKEFKNQVENTLKELNLLDIESYFLKKEVFTGSFTCEIAFKGPLYIADKTRNKFRIDAGKRTGIMKKPNWEMITSEYPETGPNYLVLVMDEKEILVEKIIALMKRNKGRDLYDTWFLIKRGVKLDRKLLNKKVEQEGLIMNPHNLPTKADYERDMKKLTIQLIPYEQVKKEVEKILRTSKVYL